MNQPLKSLTVQKLPSSKRASNRRLSADFAELLRLERAARRACFVPIPRAVARLMASNDSLNGDGAIDLNIRNGVTNGSLPWDKNGVGLAPLGRAAAATHAADARSVMLVVDQRLAMHFGSRTKIRATFWRCRLPQVVW